MYVCMYVWMHGWMDGWMNVCMDACIYAYMDDGWMNVKESGREGLNFVNCNYCLLCHIP